MDSGPIALKDLTETQLYEVFLIDYLEYQAQPPKYDKEKFSDEVLLINYLVSLGLIDTERRLIEVEHQLLDINNNDFNSDNEFLLPKDSYIYFK